MRKSRWFDRKNLPKRPGIYLCRAAFTGNQKLQWWRCFDGRSWRSGIMATNPQGELVNTAPSFESLVNDYLVAFYVDFRWRGISTENEK